MTEHGFEDRSVGIVRGLRLGESTFNYGDVLLKVGEASQERSRGGPVRYIGGWEGDGRGVRVELKTCHVAPMVGIYLVDIFFDDFLESAVGLGHPLFGERDVVSETEQFRLEPSKPVDLDVESEALQ